MVMVNKLYFGTLIALAYCQHHEAFHLAGFSQYEVPEGGTEPVPFKNSDKGLVPVGAPWYEPRVFTDKNGREWLDYNGRVYTRIGERVLATVCDSLFDMHHTVSVMDADGEGAGKCVVDASQHLMESLDQSFQPGQDVKEWCLTSPYWGLVAEREKVAANAFMSIIKQVMGTTPTPES